MTIAEAKALLLACEENKADSEMVHVFQDGVAEAAIDAVIAGHPDAMQLCIIAKQIMSIDCPRWCA